MAASTKPVRPGGTEASFTLDDSLNAGDFDSATPIASALGSEVSYGLADDFGDGYRGDGIAGLVSDQYAAPQSAWQHTSSRPPAAAAAGTAQGSGTATARPASASSMKGVDNDPGSQPSPSSSTDLQNAEQATKSPLKAPGASDKYAESMARGAQGVPSRGTFGERARHQHSSTAASSADRWQNSAHHMATGAAAAGAKTLQEQFITVVYPTDDGGEKGHSDNGGGTDRVPSQGNKMSDLPPLTATESVVLSPRPKGALELAPGRLSAVWRPRLHIDGCVNQKNYHRA
jgi:hypothetical protein